MPTLIQQGPGQPGVNAVSISTAKTHSAQDQLRRAAMPPWSDTVSSCAISRRVSARKTAVPPWDRVPKWFDCRCNTQCAL